MNEVNVVSMSGVKGQQNQNMQLRKNYAAKVLSHNEESLTKIQYNSMSQSNPREKRSLYLYS